MNQELLKSDGELVTLPGAIMPAMTMGQAVARYNLMVEFASKVMKEGHDYGVIPGTERKSQNGQPAAKNNTLLKPGAEKLCTLFGLAPIFEDNGSIVDFEGGLFHFSYNCILLRHARREIQDGKAVVIGDYAGAGIGSANSREKKYRRGARVCPICNAACIQKSKYPPRDDPGATPGWYCFAKQGGCGANFAHDDPAIVEQSQTIDKDATADLVNNLQKMATKRALVAAALIATNASEFFTQDMEDLPEAQTPAATEKKKETAAPPAKISDAMVQEIRLLAVSLNKPETKLVQWWTHERTGELSDLTAEEGKLLLAKLKESRPATPAASTPGQLADAETVAKIRLEVQRFGLDANNLLKPYRPKHNFTELTQAEAETILATIRPEPSQDREPGCEPEGE